ncbi:hypothetical protein JCM8097_001349 [Rhodosporidiobolus ruineniae]
MDAWAQGPLASTSDAAPTPAMASSAVPNTASLIKRGPVPKACSACRQRRVACKRPEDGRPGACAGCLKRGVECSLTVDTAAVRTPKPGSKSTYLPSFSLALSSLDTRLADNDMSETFGLELLTLYGDASSSCSDPIYPPPVLDYLGLRSRYEAVGRRLADLSPSDQLTCRIVFATASRLRPPKPESPTPSALICQLSINATSHADSTSIWRQPSSENATALLLLFQLVAAGEIASDEAKPYMSALINQLRTLYKSEPHVLLGRSGNGTSGLVWCVFAFNTFAAVERREASEITKREYLRFVGGKTGGMPPIQVIIDAMQHDPWSLTNLLLLPLASYVNLGRRIASLVDDLRGNHMSASDVVQVGEVWGDAESLSEYLDGVFSEVNGVVAEPFALTIFHLYTQLVYAATVFASLALLLTLERPKPAAGNPSTVATLVQQYRPRFLRLACRFLRCLRQRSGTSFLAVFTGSAWSVSRLTLFAQLIKGTSAWDAALYPGGPADKLESLNYLHTALKSVGRAYPNDGLQAVLEAVSAERSALAVLLDVPLPSPASSPAPSTSPSPSASFSSSTCPSLSLLSTWTHMLDVSERYPSLLCEFVERGGWIPAKLKGSEAAVIGFRGGGPVVPPTPRAEAPPIPASIAQQAFEAPPSFDTLSQLFPLGGDFSPDTFPFAPPSTSTAPSFFPSSLPAPAEPSFPPFSSADYLPPTLSDLPTFFSSTNLPSSHAAPPYPLNPSPSSCSATSGAVPPAFSDPAFVEAFLAQLVNDA